MDITISFRPLDGESISKLLNGAYAKSVQTAGFRPLDGESISKRKNYCSDIGYS